jgi:hypothetical protein
MDRKIYIGGGGVKVCVNIGGELKGMCGNVGKGEFSECRSLYW